MYMFIQKIRTFSDNQIITRKNQIRSQISNKLIEPNKYIHYSPIGTDIDQYYVFIAMILHHNNNANNGHFEVLLFIDDQFYQCNDTHVTQYLKNEISDATIQMFISFNLYVNNIPKDLIADDAVLNYFRLVDKNENNSIKLDIHNTHKYLNGFLDVALGLSPESEYSTAKPNYLYTQHTLEELIEILCNLIYISNSSSNGEINSMLTAHKLYIELDSAFELQIKETGEGLRQ